jgi:hypothetical protein
MGDYAEMNGPPITPITQITTHGLWLTSGRAGAQRRNQEINAGDEPISIPLGSTPAFISWLAGAAFGRPRDQSPG